MGKHGRALVGMAYTLVHFVGKMYDLPPACACVMACGRPRRIRTKRSPTNEVEHDEIVVKLPKHAHARPHTRHMGLSGKREWARYERRDE